MSKDAAAQSAFSTLQDWLTWQETLHPAEIELGLERVREVYARLQSQQPSLNKQPITITVAGTNGKGSCIKTLEALLCAHGYRIGAYSSPHIQRYNERVRVQGQEIDDESLCDSFQCINQARADISLTYFEFGTLAALDIFARAEVDVQLLEVGLGGRLDATNIIDPSVAVLLNVDLDHQAFLGDNREQIGYEKAGIFRADIPLVVGESQPPQSVLTRAAALPGAELWQVGRGFDYQITEQQFLFTSNLLPEPKGLPVPQLPWPSVACALQALLSLDISLDWAVVAQVLQGLSMPGRFQCIHHSGTELILDVAHNPHAARFLYQRLQAESEQPVLCVFSALADKDYVAVMDILAPVVSHWYLAKLPQARAASQADLAESASRARVPATVFDTIGAALAQAKNDCLQAGPGILKVLICGSFFTVAEVLSCLEVERNAV